MLIFFVRIFFPLALGYYLSYFYRTVNVVIAPDIITELNLTASDIGWVSSAYFATFALFQIPLGVLLDRYEIRKISAIMLLFAMLGALIFARADSVASLWLGRGLIGLGVSACLMTAFKAFVIWLPAQRLPLVNGLQLAAGGIGALSATAPVEMALQLTDWRGIFNLLAGATIFSALLLFSLVPKQAIETNQESIKTQLKGYVQIFKSPIFYAVAPISFLAQANFISLQSLWIGQWLRDVDLYSRSDAAYYLFVSSTAMVLGFMLMGSLAAKLQRFSISTRTVSVLGISLFIVVQTIIISDLKIPSFILWSLFGFIGTSGSLMYASLSQQFPKSLAGRVNTSLNLLLFIAIFLLQWLMGEIINIWPTNDTGQYPTIAYQFAFGFGIALQVIGLIWYFYHRKQMLKA